MKMRINWKRIEKNKIKFGDLSENKADRTEKDEKKKKCNEPVVLKLRSIPLGIKTFYMGIHYFTSSKFSFQR